jgi:Tol biopolymer transport system component
MLTRHALKWLAAVLLAAGFVSLAAARPARAFPGTNGKIAFASNRTGSYDIFVANPDGSGLTNLTATAAVDERDPAWSADGRRLAFQRDGAIWVMDADGGGQSQLTGGSPVGQIDSGPAWSPSGDEIAFGRSDISGNSGIWVVDLRGAGARQLTVLQGDSGQDRFPAWSPDGRTIAFQRDLRSQASRLAVVNADGGSETVVDTGISSGNAHPSWSPNGAEIAIDVNGGENIVTVRPDGSVVRYGVIQGDLASDPEWSPDGSAIAYTSFGEVKWQSLDGSASGNVSGGDPAIDRSPSWQPAPSAPVGNTPVGSNVVVSSGDVTITFANVTAAGDTTVSTISGPPPPAGFEVVGVYYELATTAHFDSAEVCFAYKGSPAPSIVHYVNGQPVLLTTRDTGQAVCADVTSLSPFVLVRPIADREPPALSLPANPIVNATSAAGAVVTYVVSAKDAVDSSPSIGCSPASGSTFPIGQTTVSCTATDASGNSSSGSFTVKVKGAREQLADLIQKVVNASQLSPAAKTLLIGKLNQLLASFDPSNATQRQAVCLALQVFKAAVQLQAGKTITQAQAAEWIADANRIRAVLGC